MLSRLIFLVRVVFVCITFFFSTFVGAHKVEQKRTFFRRAQYDTLYVSNPKDSNYTNKPVNVDNFG